jgi:hypothetical protein
MLTDTAYLYNVDNYISSLVLSWVLSFLLLTQVCSLLTFI